MNPFPFWVEGTPPVALWILIISYMVFPFLHGYIRRCHLYLSAYKLMSSGGRESSFAMLSGRPFSLIYTSPVALYQISRLGKYYLHSGPE